MRSCKPEIHSFIMCLDYTPGANSATGTVIPQELRDIVPQFIQTIISIKSFSSQASVDHL